jgi:hypothetical protein
MSVPLFPSYPFDESLFGGATLLFNKPKKSPQTPVIPGCSEGKNNYFFLV